MPLSQPELGLLQMHAINNYLVSKIYPDYSAISSWYNSIPVLVLADTIKLLTPMDRVNYFAFTNFPTWYSGFCQKIHDNTTVKILNLTNDQINLISLELLSSLISKALNAYTMQQLVEQMINRKLYTELDYLLKCLGANGDFLETTLLKLSTEVNSNYTRWQALGLSAAPTPAEIQSILP